MTRDHVTLFPDTNILLHYPPLSNVDWKTVCDADAVKIVICLAVIDELDAKKYDSRLGERADSAIKEIETLTESGDPVREGVSIEIYQPGILSGSGDKLIVEQISDYIDETGDENVAVYSDDAGMRLRCRPHNIEVIKPDRNTRDPLPQSESDKKYKAVMTELAKEKDKRPDLQVFLAKTKSDQIPGESFEIKLAHVVEQIDYEQLYQEEERRLRRTQSFPQICEEKDIRKFYKEFNEYLPKLKAWASVQNEAIDEQARQFQFYIVIKNVGKAPAEDIDLYLTIPSIIKYIKGEKQIIGDFLHYPSKPAPPEPPVTKIAKQLKLDSQIAHSLFGRDRASDIMHVLPNNQIILPSKKVSIEFYANECGGFKIHIYIPKLKHLYKLPFGPFDAAFKSWKDVHPFNIGLEIHADNLPDGINGSILVKAEVKEPEE